MAPLPSRVLDDLPDYITAQRAAKLLRQYDLKILKCPSGPIKAMRCWRRVQQCKDCLPDGVLVCFYVAPWFSGEEGNCTALPKFSQPIENRALSRRLGKGHIDPARDSPQVTEYCQSLVSRAEFSLCNRRQEYLQFGRRNLA